MKIDVSPNWLVAVAICLVVGCASDKQPSSQVASAPLRQPEPGKGLIVFYRESQFAGGGVPFIILEVNTQPPTKIVDLANGRYYAYGVTPGKHRFAGTKSASYLGYFNTMETVTEGYYCDMNIEANTTYYVHAEMIQKGLVTHPKLSVADAQQASEAIKKLKASQL